MLTKVVYFVALLSTAVALGGALAHLFELSNKIDLPQASYFVVQQIYRGWWQLAYVLVVELLSILALIVLSHGQPKALWPAVAALLCLVCAQVVFWVFTQPANAATSNWSIQSANWQTLRQQWEYSHAAGALFQLLTMSSLIISVLARIK